MNEIILNNVNMSQSGGSLLYHSYPKEPMTTILFETVTFTDNAQIDINSTSEGQSLIVIREDGTGCNQLPSDTTFSNFDSVFL